MASIKFNLLQPSSAEFKNAWSYASFLPYATMLCKMDGFSFSRKNLRSRTGLAG